MCRVKRTAAGTFDALGSRQAYEVDAKTYARFVGIAVANALSSLGVEPNALPLSPPKVWAMVQAASSGR